jgi:hypothetical protein
VRYGLGFYIPEDCILHIHRRENLKSYKFWQSILRKVIAQKAAVLAMMMIIIDNDPLVLA